MARKHKGKVFELHGWWLDQVPGSPFWYGHYYDANSGRVRRKSLGVTNFEEAKSALAIKALIAAPKNADSFLSAILETYCSSLEGRPGEPAARYAGAVLLEFWGKTARVADVNFKRQEAFAEWSRTKKNHSVSYIARNLGVLSAALRHTLEAGAPRVRSGAKAIAKKLNVLHANSLRQPPW